MVPTCRTLVQEPLDVKSIGKYNVYRVDQHPSGISETYFLEVDETRETTPIIETLRQEGHPKDSKIFEVHSDDYSTNFQIINCGVIIDEDSISVVNWNKDEKLKTMRVLEEKLK
jgi:hypothetical protein